MYEDLITAIRAAIKPNGREEVTGQVLQNALVAIVETLGGLKFGGLYEEGMEMQENTFYLAGPSDYEVIGQSINPGTLGVIWMTSEGPDSILINLAGSVSFIEVTDADTHPEIPEDGVLYFCKPGEYNEFTIPQGQWGLARNTALLYLSPAPMIVGEQPNEPYWGQVVYDGDAGGVSIYTPDGWKIIETN